MIKKNNNLLFKIAIENNKAANFSALISDADFSNNQLFLNSVVGTLVKYGTSGRIESYIANEWTVSNDKKTWIFNLLPNLKSEDNQIIDANLFKKCFEKNLKQLSINSSVIDFDHLLGYDKFKLGKTESIRGLIAKDLRIEFHFSAPPTDLLELLRMPYFGIWIEDNNKNLISTSAYRLKELLPNKVKLELRKNWFTAKPDSFENVELSYNQLDEILFKTENPTIIKLPFYHENVDIDGMYWIQSPPTRFEGFVLSPYKNNFFNYEQNRHAFLNNLRSQNNGYKKSDFMYLSAKSDVKNNTRNNYLKHSDYNTLTFALERSSYSETEINSIKELIRLALKNLKLNFEIIFRDSDKNFFKKTDSNNYYDARITTVDIGGYPDYSTLHMMFCTKLGVNFPDYGDKICALIKKYKIDNEKMNQSFISSFNQILADDAIIVPINHYSEKWLVSSIIDSKFLPPTTRYPLFEKINIIQ